MAAVSQMCSRDGTESPAAAALPRDVVSWPSLSSLLVEQPRELAESSSAQRGWGQLSPFHQLLPRAGDGILGHTASSETCSAHE